MDYERHHSKRVKPLDDECKLKDKRLSRGCTSLMYACQHGLTETLVQQLRTKPSLVLQRDRSRKSALHYCSGQRDLVAAASVAVAAPELLESADDDGFTPLHLAVIQGNMALANLLIANAADVNALDNERHSVVHWATVCGEIEALRAVLTAGADVSTPDINGGSPLHYAAQMCGAHYDGKTGQTSSKLALEILNILLLHPKSSVDVVDKDGRQPLLWAASAGSAKAVLALVKAGARVESSDKDGLTALHCAASRGHTECIDTLIGLCGAPTDLIDSNGCTSLHYAVTLGHADATSLLLDLEADPNRQDRKGRTPAHCGCAKGQFETVKLLRERGANLWLRNAKGDLPLHEAASSGRRDLVQWLIDQRPNQVNTTSNDGRTLLHIAACNDNTDMCKMLLDYGADVNSIHRTMKNIVMTPLDCSLQKGYRSTAKFLQSHGGLPANKLRLSGRQPNALNDQELVKPLKLSEKEQQSASDDLQRSKSKKYVVYVKNSESTEEQQHCGSKSKSPKRRRKVVCHHHHRHRHRRRTNSCETVKICKEDNSSSDICRSKSNIEIHRYRRSKSKKCEAPSTTDESSSESCCRHKKRYYMKKKDHERRAQSKTRGHASSETESDEVIKKRKKRKDKKSRRSEEQPSDESKADEPKKIGKNDESLKADVRTNNRQEILKESESGGCGVGGGGGREGVVGDKSEFNQTELTTVIAADGKIPTEDTKLSGQVTFQTRPESAKQKRPKSARASSASATAAAAAAALKQENEQKMVETDVKADDAVVEAKHIETIESLRKSLDLSDDAANDNGGKLITTQAEVHTTTDDGKRDEKAIEKANDLLTVKKEHVKDIDDFLTDATYTVDEPKVIKERKLKAARVSEKIDERVEASKAFVPLANDDDDVVATTQSLNGGKIELSESNKAVKSHEILSPEKVSSPKVTHTNEVTAERKEATKQVHSSKKSAAGKKNGTTPPEATKSSAEMEQNRTSNVTTKSANSAKGDRKEDGVSHSFSVLPVTGAAEELDDEHHQDDGWHSSQQQLEPAQKQSSSHRKRMQLQPSLRGDEETADETTSASQDQEEYNKQQSPAIMQRLEVVGDETVAARKSSFTVLQSDNSVEPMEPELSEETPQEGDREMMETSGDGGVRKQSFHVIGTEEGQTEGGGASDAYSTEDDTDEFKKRLETRVSRSALDRNGRRKRMKRRPDSKRLLDKEHRSQQQSRDQDSGFEPSPRAIRSTTKIPTPRHIHTAMTPRRKSFSVIDGRSCSSRLEGRKPGDKNAVNMTTVTQAIHQNIKRYYMERKIFQHLLELKSLQIRSSKVNESVLVKRAVDDYHKSVHSLRMEMGGPTRRYTYKEYSFKNFEMFLYETLKSLQKTGTFNFQNISDVYKEAERRLSPDYTRCSKALHCTTKTHRCLHAAHAYTGIPCAAYIPMMNHHTMPKYGFGTYKTTGVGSFYLPKILTQNAKSGNKMSLELSHGNNKQLISLPSEKLDSNKRYYVTFTVKENEKGTAAKLKSLDEQKADKMDNKTDRIEKTAEPASFEKCEDK